MIKKISFYLGLGGIICLVQSCGGVYNSANLTVDSAIESNQPLKVKTTEGTVYKISRLKKVWHCSSGI